MRTLAELYQAWADGRLEAQELDEMKVLLRAPAGRRDLVRQMWLDSSIRDALQLEAGAEAVEEERQEAKTEAEKKSAASSRRLAVSGAMAASGRPSAGVRTLRWLTWGSMAAGLTMAILAAAYGLNLFHAQKSRVEGFVVASGQKTRILRAGADIPCAAGMAVRSGDVFSVPEGGFSTVQYEDGTLVEAGGGSRMAFNTDNGDIPHASGAAGASGAAKRVLLDRGSLRVRAAPQASPMVLLTAKMEIFVLGTEFVFQHGATGTSVLLREGLLRVRRASDGSTLDLFPGMAAFAGGEGADFAAKPYAEKPEKVVIEGRLAACDLAAGFIEMETGSGERLLMALELVKTEQRWAVSRRLAEALSGLGAGARVRVEYVKDVNRIACSLTKI